ncbi:MULTISPECIES: SGNH/GDSL hydrolase family protein [unclassified Knoellia]|uniref:SGNH/GDSL hydrolase family protein n=1 Tax=Knoellia altitudinis TaxID=3404795 RepID=UPI00361D7807
MNDRLENGALAALLVLTLVLVGFSLRSRGPEAAAPQTSASTTPSMTTAPSPSSSASSTTGAGSVVFLGDSVAEGRSATTRAKRWTSLVAADLGLKEVNLGHARTGYLRKGSEGSCGDAACPNFEGMVDEVVRAKPSAVVVTGGGNDAGLPAEDFSQAVSDTLGDLRKALPQAKIYVVNPWWDLRPVPESLTAQTSAVRAAATAAGVTYLDTKQPLVDQPELMVAGGTNPNDAGHAALAKVVSEAIGQTSTG